MAFLHPQAIPYVDQVLAGFELFRYKVLPPQGGEFLPSIQVTEVNWIAILLIVGLVVIPLIVAAIVAFAALLGSGLASVMSERPQRSSAKMTPRSIVTSNLDDPRDHASGAAQPSDP